VIYVKSLASCTQIAKEIRIFEQEQRSKESKEDLKATLDFLKRTMTSTIKPTP
jgi:hypothetical protein